MRYPTPGSRSGLGMFGRALACFAAAGLASLLAAPPTAADAVRDRQWHLDALNVAEAHQITRGGGVTVAVIDSRAEITHPDLADNTQPGENFVANEGSIRDPGHAVRVASIIAGHGHGPGNQDGVLGIASEAKVLPARAIGDPINTAEGVRWAVDQGATVINVSLGYTFNDPDLEIAIAYAQANDVVIVAAAGNTIQGDVEVAYPAAYPGVVAVSATGRSGRLSDVSVTGPNVELAAPGEDIQVAELGGGYSVKTGTSEATPMVAGTAALIRAQHPDLTAASVINRLIQTATDAGEEGKDSEYGHGIVDPVQALTSDVPPVQQNPLGTLAEPTSAATSPGGAAPPGDGDSGPGAVLLAGLAVAVLALLAGVIAVIIRATRRRPAPASARRGPPGALPYPPPAAHPTAAPPHRPYGPPSGQPGTHPPPPGPGWQPPPPPPPRR